MPSLVAKRFRQAERVLLFVGLALIATWAGFRVYSIVSARTAIERFEAREKTPPTDSDEGAQPLRSNLPVDFHLWSPKRVTAYQESLSQKLDSPIAILRIPKIELEVPVFNGTDDLTLDRGVGRISGTAQIGVPGNLGIAGHRDGFFRGLQSIGTGDRIELVRPGHTDDYGVSEIRIVTPDDVSVLNRTTTPTLTLVTCFPFYVVGHAPKRYIVTAVMENAQQSQGAISARNNITKGEQGNVK